MNFIEEIQSFTMFAKRLMSSMTTGMITPYETLNSFLSELSNLILDISKQNALDYINIKTYIYSGDKQVFNSKTNIVNYSVGINFGRTKKMNGIILYFESDGEIYGVTFFPSSDMSIIVSGTNSRMKVVISSKINDILYTYTINISVLTYKLQTKKSEEKQGEEEIIEEVEESEVVA